MIVTSALTMAAWLLGLRDPAPAAAAVAAAQPAQLDSLAAVLDGIATWAADGAEDVLASVSVLRVGWTAAGPGNAVDALRAAAVEAAASTRGMSAAVRAAAAELGTAVAQSAAAVARAEAAAAGWPPMLAGWVLADYRSERAGVIDALNAALDAALSTMSAAVSTLMAALASDPRDSARALCAASTATPTGSAGPISPSGPTGAPGVDRSGTGLAARTDRTNRAALAADRASGDAFRRSFADAVDQSLGHAGADGGTVQLLLYDPTAFGDQGRVAIGVGDLAAADNIAVLTPGISNSPMAMSGTIDAAAALRAEATRQDPDARTAVVTWFGYDIPLSWPLDRPGSSAPMPADTLAVLNADRAAAGGDLLATDVGGFAAMAPASALVTLVGHSMGSATTSESAGRHAVRADNLVLTGSPGAGSDVATASGYRSVTPGHVFVESYDGDPITRGAVDLGAFVLGVATATPVHFHPFGPDPAAAGFGAQVVDSAGTAAHGDRHEQPGPPTGISGTGQHAITNYFSGSSLVATARVVTGRYSGVRVKRGR